MLAWKNLKCKYEPLTKLSLVSLQKQFAQSRLEDAGRDPEEWINDLEHLHMRINGVRTNSISDEDMVTHILGNLPEEYSELATTASGESNGTEPY